MLNITLNEDCNQFSVTNTNINAIEHIDFPLVDTCCVKLKLGVNCCETLNVPIRSLYLLEANLINCGSRQVDSLFEDFIQFSISGVDVGCVKTLKYNRLDISNSSYTFTGDIPSDGNSILIDAVLSREPFPETLIVEITTTCGLTYTVTIEITGNYSDPSNFCSTVGFTYTIQYPDMPSGVSVSADSLTLYLTPNAFGIDLDTFYDGVYYIETCENSESESNSYFVNCQTTCAAIDYVSENECTNLFSMIESLNFSNDCDTITYAQKCAIWNYVGRKLNYFSVTPCEVPSNCGCN